MNDRRASAGSVLRNILSRRPDFADVLLCAVPFLALFPLRNNDLWWHLAAGREMLERGGFLRDDPFSFTGFMGSWIDNEWLSEIVLYGAWRIGGNLGLVVLRASLYTAVFVVVRSLLRAGRRPSAFLPCLVVGIALSHGWWEIRPSVFSVLGTLILLLILERIRRSSRGFAALPVLFLVWAWLHPGFLFGACLLVGTVASLYLERLLPSWPRWSGDARVRGRLLASTALSLLATLAGPYGWGVYRQQASIAGNAAYRAVLDEWAPPSPLFLALVLATVGLFAVARFRKLAPACWVPVLGAAALSTTAVRFEEYFALVAVPALLMGLGPPRARGPAPALVAALMVASVLAGLKAPLSAASPEGHPSAAALDAVDARVGARLQRNAAILSAVLAAMLAGSLRRGRAGVRWALARSRGRLRTVPVVAALCAAGVLASIGPRLGLLPGDHVEPGRYPEACLSALPRDDARVFNRLSWGGWLIWRTGLRTFIDGRCWGQPIFFEYLRCHGPGFREVFDAHAVDRAVVASYDTLAVELSRAADWEPICRDDVAVVFRRRRAR